MTQPTVSEMETYIRQAAQARGIDPDVAVRVARSEGLQENTWQSRYRRGGYREPSYGPFQLLMGGPGTGFPRGMGNDFQRVTGLNPSDPANTYAGIDYALDRAAQEGWGAWYGAPKVGVSRRQGLANARPIGVSGRPGLSAGMESFMEQPNRVAAMPVNTDLAALGSMNVTAAPTPAVRRENPANRQFADNAVGPLTNRQTRPTPRTVQQMLSGAPEGSFLAGGPAERALGMTRTPAVTASARPGIGAGNRAGGAMSLPARENQPSEVANSRVVNAWDDIGQAGSSVAASNVPEAARYSKRGNIPGRITPSAQVNRNPFDTMRGSNMTPSQRVTQTFNDLPGGAAETAYNAPLEPLSAPQTVAPPPTVAAFRTDMSPPVPNMRPKSPSPQATPDALRRAGQLARAIMPSSIPARAATLAGGFMGGPLGAAVGRLAGGGINALVGNGMPTISVGRASYNRTPQGRAVQAATRNGGFDNAAYTRTYAQAGGADDGRSYSRALAEEQRQRSRDGQKTIGDAFSEAFGWR